MRLPVAAGRAPIYDSATVLRDYTPENESFRDDFVAILGASAVVIAVMGTWTKPLLMGPVALVVAAIAYVLAPRSKGYTIVAVLVITLFALLETALRSASLI